MFPPEGNIGCVVDPELALDSRSPAPAFYLNYSAAPASDTPDTSFYQWVPFILILQVPNSQNLGFNVFHKHYLSGSPLLRPAPDLEIL